jgi:hypothetical protein
LEQALVRRFTDRVMRRAELPLAQRHDVAEAPSFEAGDGEIRCTCGITGSTYASGSDGTAEKAGALADEAAEGSAWLNKNTPRYAWLRASG